MKKPEIRAAIFDLDGTLAETLDDLQTAANRMRAALGYGPIAREKILQEVHHDSITYIRNCLPEDARSEEVIQKATEIYKAQYAACYADQTYAYEGMREMVFRMKAAGKPMAVISNKLDMFTKTIAQKLYGEDVFILIVGSGGEYPHKPDPFTANLFARQTGIAPENIAIIGDAETDVDTAVNAGMVPVAVSWGYTAEKRLKARGARFVAHSVAELDRILNG